MLLQKVMEFVKILQVNPFEPLMKKIQLYGVYFEDSTDIYIQLHTSIVQMHFHEVKVEFFISPRLKNQVGKLLSRSSLGQKVLGENEYFKISHSNVEFLTKCKSINIIVCNLIKPYLIRLIAVALIGTHQSVQYMKEKLRQERIFIALV